MPQATGREPVGATQDVQASVPAARRAPAALVVVLVAPAAARAVQAHALAGVQAAQMCAQAVMTVAATAQDHTLDAPDVQEHAPATA